MLFFFFFFDVFFGVNPIKIFANKHMTQKTGSPKAIHSMVFLKRPVFYEGFILNNFKGLLKKKKVFDLQGKRDGGDQELRVFSRSGD